MPLIPDREKNFLEEITSERLVPSSSIIDFQIRDGWRGRWSDFQKLRARHFNQSTSENRRLDRHFKEYPWTPSLALQPSLKAMSEKGLPALLKARETNRQFSGERSTFTELSELLHFASGKKKAGELKIINPSGGRRHSLELYVFARNVTGLKSSLYHYNPLKDVLEDLGPVHSNWLGEIFPDSDPALSQCAFVIFFTGIPARSTIKYGHLGYRLIFLEAGHLSQSLWLLATEREMKVWPLSLADQSKFHSTLKINPAQEFFVFALVCGR